MRQLEKDSKELSQVFVVNASAGSGKTYCLAKRYLQLLMSQNSLKSLPLRVILAITFTNKATVEMKQRILDFLKKIIFDSFSNYQEKEDILKSLSLPYNEAKEKAKTIMNQMIKHYSFFQVQTIDSFINAVLLGAAIKIERSAHFKISRDYSSYLEYGIDILINKAKENKELLSIWEDFLSHYLFVENQKGWFPQREIAELMLSLFRLHNKYGAVFMANPFSSVDLFKMKKEIFADVKKLSSNLPEGINKTAAKSISKFIEDSNPLFEIKDFPNKFKDEDVPMNKGKECSADIEKLWKAISKKITEIVQLESEIAYNPYVRLFNWLYEVFSQLSKDDDVIFLGELNSRARNLFSQDGLTVAELYYNLATRFKHYLIDEFQDTSLLQWNNLYMMIEEALSTGGSLFYVGDKKQAIYRFRGGDSYLFDAVKNNFSHFNVIENKLVKNWRSQKTIVEFNNKIFSQKNLNQMLISSGIAEEVGPSRYGIEHILDVFKDSKQQYCKENNLGYVSVNRVDYKNQDERNQIVKDEIISLIKQLKKRFDYSDIAVLTRDNDEVEIVSSWFFEENIPVESEKTLNVLENKLIKELICFLKFLNSPIDDLQFSGFILGEMFLKVSGLSYRQVESFLLCEHNKEEKRTVSLYLLFKRKFPQVWQDLIDPFFKSVGFISAYELLLQIYQQFNLPVMFAQNQAYLMKLLELVKLTEDEYIGLGDFLGYLEKPSKEDLYVNVVANDAVRVVTVHKAKGLEFNVVILPFLRMDISAETGGKGTQSHVVMADYDLKLLRITKDYSRYSQKLASIYADDYLKSCVDELNNLYVALTRARNEMYIYIPAKSANAKNKALFLIPEELTNLGKINNYSKKDNPINNNLIKIGPSDYKNWISYLKNEYVLISEISNRKQIEYGNIMHAILSEIKNCSSSDWKQKVEGAVDKIALTGSKKIDKSFYFNEIIKFLSSNNILRFFSCKDCELFCEKEIANSFGDLKRIDRLVVTANEVWAIDFKTSKDGFAAQENQVKDYVFVLKDIYTKKQIKGFLLYLNNSEVVEING